MTLSFDPATLRLPKGHFIDGRYVEGADALEIRRPSDGKPLAAIPVADAALVDEAIRISARVQRESDWATCMPRDRARILRRFADLIDEEAGYLAQLEAVCSTRPITQARQSDVVNCADHIRFFAEFADKEGGQVVPTAGAQMGMILHEPYGVIGAIAPWNVPLSMAAWKLGPALAAGNGIVIKPSEMTPFSTLYLAELAVRAGIPAGLVNVVLGDGPVTGTAITTHPLVGKVSFTGSTRAGAQIMQDIARTGIKPMTLELGGKSPQVVFADADIDLAAALRRGARVLGLCGGYQMLGRTISDPDGIEGAPTTVPGLGLLAVHTVMTPDKRVTLTEAVHVASGQAAQGYEIHLGQTEGPDRARPLFTVEGQPEGAISADGRVMGSYLHGLFSADGFRAAFLRGLGASAGSRSYAAGVEEALEALADHLEAHADCEALLGIAKAGL